MFPHIEVEIGRHPAYTAHDIHEKHPVHLEKPHGKIGAPVVQRRELQGQYHDHVVAVHPTRIVEQFDDGTSAGAESDHPLGQIGRFNTYGQPRKVL